MKVSCETGSVVPSRVSLFILQTRAEYDAYSRDPLLPLTTAACINIYQVVYTINRHRLSAEFIGSRNCVSMTFTAERPGTGTAVLKLTRVTVAKCASLSSVPVQGK